MEIHKADLNDTELFDNHALKAKGSFLQTWTWGDVKSKFGWRPERLFFISEGDIVATASVLIKKLPLGVSMAYLPQGPVINYDSEDPELVLEVFNNLARAVRTTFMRVDPPIVEGSNTVAKTLHALRKAGFVKSFEETQPRDTLILDLTKTEDELLASMHQKGRYNIRLAEKKGIKVEEKNDPESIKEFIRLYHLTAVRAGLSEHDDAYISEVISQLSQKKMCRLFVASLDKSILSAILVIFFGDTATYLYGGSSDEFREFMPNHAVQWQAIKKAKEIGFSKYDFWGIAPDDDPKHSWAGITRFKKQFGGEAVRYIGAYDRPVNKSRYLAFKSAQKIRKKMRKRS